MGSLEIQDVFEPYYERRDEATPGRERESVRLAKRMPATKVPIPIPEKQASRSNAPAV